MPPEQAAGLILRRKTLHLDWRQMALQHVFSHLTERLPAMQEAHVHLWERCHPICSRVRSWLGFDGDVVFVIYVGIGCGAGWATRFRGSPGMLFGQENIAERDWSDASTIAGRPWTQDPGGSYAKKVVRPGIVEVWFLRRTRLPSLNGVDTWLDWCRRHRAWLASEFLKRVASGRPVSPFFGSWFQIVGSNGTRYFLAKRPAPAKGPERFIKMAGLFRFQKIGNCRWFGISVTPARLAALFRPLLHSMSR